MPLNAASNIFEPHPTAATQLFNVEAAAQKLNSTTKALTADLDFHIKGLRREYNKENEQLKSQSQFEKTKNAQLLKENEQLKHRISELESATVAAEVRHQEAMAKVANLDEAQKDNVVLKQRIDVLLEFLDGLENTTMDALHEKEELKVEMVELKRKLDNVRSKMVALNDHEMLKAEFNKLKGQFEEATDKVKCFQVALSSEHVPRIEDARQGPNVDLPLTEVGTLVRKNYILVGGGEIDFTHSSTKEALCRATSEPNVLADSLIFKKGALSVDVDGSKFVERYGSPYLPNLDYAAFPRFCEIMNIEGKINAWIGPNSSTRSSEKWSERQKLILELQNIWGVAKAKGTRDFELSEIVVLKIEELRALSEDLIAKESMVMNG